MGALLGNEESIFIQSERVRNLDPLDSLSPSNTCKIPYNCIN